MSAKGNTGGGRGLVVCMAKRSVGDLKEAELKGKVVFVRADLNVPLDDKFNITDDTRIRAAIPTIKYLIGNGAKVVLTSHLVCFIYKRLFVLYLFIHFFLLYACFASLSLPLYIRVDLDMFLGWLHVYIEQFLQCCVNGCMCRSISSYNVARIVACVDRSVLTMLPELLHCCMCRSISSYNVARIVACIDQLVHTMMLQWLHV